MSIHKGYFEILFKQCFCLFPVFYSRYLKHFLEKSTAKPNKLTRIMYEYYKLQVAQRYRINMNYAKYDGLANIVTYPPKEEDVLSVILKHERIANRQLTDDIIAITEKYLSEVEDTRLESKLKDIESIDRKEIPRFPIPYGLIINMVKDPNSIKPEELQFLKLD